MTQPANDHESLQVLLARVHERLNEAGSADVGSRELLGQVMADIERALQKDGTAAPSVPTAAVKANTPRLEALAVQFEADHPDLAASLRRFADLLGKAGI